MVDDAGSLNAEASLLLVKRKVEAKALEVIEREEGGHAVELDLLVPEYVESDEDLVNEPWCAGAMALAKRGKTVLINPHPDVYLLLFARSKANRTSGTMRP